jgi:deazaflavin-dependent oxidoreductase (nitroreductase family)
MPSDFALKGMNFGHKVIKTVSFGRLGRRALGMPVVELTTTGRKSGKARTSFLTAPLVLDDDELVIVASRGGDDTHPAWFLNLRDQPEVSVKVEGGESGPMVARITSGDERSELWERLSTAHDNYAGYQTKTDREIPVIVLGPVDA